MEKTLLIQGGTVVTELGTCPADVLISGERIAAVAAPGILKAEETFDASGRLLFPGGIDPHVHISRKNNKSDDFYTGSCAALAGGTTTVIDFCEPDADETAMDCIADRKARGLESAADYAFHFAFTESYRQELRVLDQILAEGITSFKAFTCYENTTLNRGDLAEIFRAIRDIGPILIHSEAEDICRKSAERLLGAPPDDFTNQVKARPALAEQICVADIDTLARRENAAVCIAHLSSESGLTACGGRLHAETCPHYLAFTERNVAGARGALYTMTPPLRREEDNKALWNGLLSGRIEMFSTDHCAFPEESKLTCKDWRKVPNGVGGIQQRMQYLYSEGVVKRGMPLGRFVSLTSANAARFYGLWPRKGCIACGSDADIAVLDPRPSWTFQKGDIMGAEDHSLYEGLTLKGRICAVFRRGALVYKDGRLRAERGQGKYLPRKP